MSTQAARRPAVRNLVVAGTAALLLTVAAPLAADAHVRVIPDSTASGGFAQLTFRVPDESDTASTTSVVVKLPQRSPLAFVSVKPMPGWTAKVEQAPLAKPVEVEGTTVTKAPSKVTWTATGGGGIRPGEYLDFSISAGPLPAPGRLSLPVTQVYSDGRSVNWSQPTVDGGTEPENPAPSFTVTAATAGAGAGSSTADAAGSTTAAGARAAAPATVKAPTDAVSRWLSGAALAVALLTALAVGLTVLRPRRR